MNLLEKEISANSDFPEHMKPLNTLFHAPVQFQKHISAEGGKACSDIGVVTHRGFEIAHLPVPFAFHHLVLEQIKPNE